MVTRAGNSGTVIHNCTSPTVTTEIGANRGMTLHAAGSRNCSSPGPRVSSLASHASAVDIGGLNRPAGPENLACSRFGGDGHSASLRPMKSRNVRRVTDAAIRSNARSVTTKAVPSKRGHDWW